MTDDELVERALRDRTPLEPREYRLTRTIDLREPRPEPKEWR